MGREFLGPVLDDSADLSLSPTPTNCFSELLGLHPLVPPNMVWL